MVCGSSAGFYRRGGNARRKGRAFQETRGRSGKETCRSCLHFSLEIFRLQLVEEIVDPLVGRVFLVLILVLGFGMTGGLQDFFVNEDGGLGAEREGDRIARARV